MLECVVNVSEGRDRDHLAALTDAAGTDLLDVHSDPHHHRTVLTLHGLDAPRRVAETAVELLDLRAHAGVHPRLGVIDVVPFVPLAAATMAEAIAARDSFAQWLARELEVPVFLYGSERSLPEIRRRAFADVLPDLGPPKPHSTAGATCVGARPVLVAYNLWIDGIDLSEARTIASTIRRPGLRALGLSTDTFVQVSMNLVEPTVLGPAQAYDLVAERLPGAGGSITRAELVGLLPREVLLQTQASEWDRLGISEEQTIEARLDAARRG
ncbi:MAG: hypothetical protein ABIP36_07950 [Acidimicrobiales bacterium]